MLQKIRDLKKSRRGFTLVEIIVVLVILAILAAFTIPAMLGFVQDAKSKAYLAEAREVYVAAQSSATEYLAKGASASDVIKGIEGFKGTALTGDQGLVQTKMNAYITNDVSTGASITGVAISNGNVSGFTYTIKPGDGKQYAMKYENKTWTTTVTNA